MITLRINYPISTNRMWRNFQGRMVMSAEGKAFKQHVAYIARSNSIHMLEGDVEVQIILHPKLTKKGAASKTRLDIDNALKCALDSLNGIAYADDSQIVRLVAEIGLPVEEGAMQVNVQPIWELKP